MIKLTETNYDETIGKGNAVAFITSAWCGHCQASKPAFNVLADKLEGYTCGMTDIAENEELAGKLSITNLPVIIVYKDGKEVGRTTKVESVDSMKEWIEGLTNQQ